MCNIGAGAALGILEKFNIKSKAARCIGMVSGIILTGVISGSAIANYISNKLINPMISKDCKKENRTPELLDEQNKQSANNDRSHCSRHKC